MTGDRADLQRFLGTVPDARLLREDLSNLPGVELPREPPVHDTRHERLVTVGSVLTGASLLGGLALVGYACTQLDGGGVVPVILGVIGLVLVATHWGWVHVAEYAGISIDARHRRETDAERARWLAAIEPYPRRTVVTSVDDAGAVHVEQFLHRPVLAGPHTFTFTRDRELDHVHAVDTPAEVIAADVASLREQARQRTDRIHEQWDDASAAYEAALLEAGDDEEQREVRRATALALSEHLNAQAGE